MAKNPIDPEAIRKQLKDLIDNFEEELKRKDLRKKVLSLVLVFQNLRAPENP